jgi:hypothetical protein
MRRSGSVPILAIVGVAAAIAFLGLMAAESMRTTALTTKEAISQNPAAETSAGRRRLSRLNSKLRHLR